MRILLALAMLAMVIGCRSASTTPPATASPATAPAPSVDGSVASRDGVAIHYHVEGSGAPAIVFLHGWACDGSVWDGQVREFAPHYTVVTIDLAGHGRSGRNRAAWTMPAFAWDARAVIEKLRLKRVVLVGHSMSGYVILETARMIPDRIAALVPVDTLQDAEWKPGANFNKWMQTMQKDFVPSTREFVKGMFPDNADPALVEKMANQMSLMPPAIGMPVLRAIFSYDKTAALSRVKRPIRAINSDAMPTRLEVNQKYAPQFEVVYVRGTGHFPMLEKPAKFNRLLSQAIDELAPPAPREAGA